MYAPTKSVGMPNAYFPHLNSGYNSLQNLVLNIHTLIHTVYISLIIRAIEKKLDVY